MFEMQSVLQGPVSPRRQMAAMAAFTHLAAATVLLVGSRLAHRERRAAVVLRRGAAAGRLPAGRVERAARHPGANPCRGAGREDPDGRPAG